jgi:hypothetical protein
VLRKFWSKNFRTFLLFYKSCKHIYAS